MSERKSNFKLEESESPDAKRYRKILKEASEEIDSKMEENHDIV